MRVARLCEMKALLLARSAHYLVAVPLRAVHSLLTAAPLRGYQAEQLHGVPAAPATHALRDFAPRPRNAQHGTRSPAAEEVRGCCAARNATLHVAALTPVAAVSVSSGPRVHAALVHFERC